MIPEPWVQGLHCRCIISWNWAPQLCILILCGFLYWSLSVAKRSFLGSGMRTTLEKGLPYSFFQSKL